CLPCLNPGFRPFTSSSARPPATASAPFLLQSPAQLRTSRDMLRIGQHADKLCVDVQSFRYCAGAPDRICNPVHLSLQNGQGTLTVASDDINAAVGLLQLGRWNIIRTDNSFPLISELNSQQIDQLPGAIAPVRLRRLLDVPLIQIMQRML